MMKKTDKETLDMLRGEFTKSTESAQVPLRLQKESIVTMLKNGDSKTKDFSSETGNKRNNVIMIRRFAAAAAVLAVVIVAVMLANQGGVKVIKTDTYNSYNKEKPVMSAMNYADIVQAVQEIRNIKSASSGKPVTDKENTVASTKPDEQTIVGGYNEYVAQEITETENAGPGADVLSDPNPGSNSESFDSADIIKNDGDYIYIVTNENDPSTGAIAEQIEIIKADPAEEMQVVKKLTLFDGKKSDYTENCIEIYLRDNKLTAIMNCERQQSKSNSFYIEKSTVAITYDISDPTNPVQIRRHTQDGEYISSGLYGNNLRIVTKKSIPEFSENAEIDMNSVIPSFTVNGKSTQLTEKEIFIAVNDPDASYLFITVTDISNSDAEPGRLAVLGAGKDIYNLANAMVIARGFVSVEADENGEHSSLTEIFRFDINGASINFVGSYVAEGSFISGNAVDEHNGYLRMAVTQAGAYDIYVFNEKMEYVCRITDFLENKVVNRVKFIGDRVYFISETENGDEIWVIDISDPGKTVKAVMLPTDGFLQMLSPVSENVILGITEYPDDKNSFAGQKGRFFLCDVSDAKNPVIISYYELMDGYSYPMGTDQRQAVLDTENMIFASPVRQADISKGEIPSAYIVFDISQNEFEYIGSYKHVGEDGIIAERCIVSGDNFYTVSRTSITAFSTEEQSIVSSVSIR